MAEKEKHAKINIMNKTIIPAVIIVALIIGGAIVYINKAQCPSEPSNALSSQEAGEKTISFINNELLGGRAVASLVDIKEENGLYKIVFVVGEQEVESYVTYDGEIFFPEAIKLTEVESPAETTIGNFLVSDNEVCQEEGKPIVYFFGSESCSYCRWEHPIVEEVAGKFGEEISFHNNVDNQEDRDVFQEYSTGGIPTVILGCKYSRVGAGQDEEEEIKNLTALICKLTDGKPSEVCDEVQDLINQLQ